MNHKNKKFFAVLICLAMLLLSLTACNGKKTTSAEPGSGSGGIEKMTIKLAGMTPPGHPLTVGAEKFKELVEQKTDGKVTVELYPNLQLGSIREQTEQVQIGTVHMTQTLLSTVTSFNAEALQVFEYPFLWPNDEEKIWQVLSGDAGKTALKGLENSRFKGFGFWAGGFKSMTSKGKPILSPDDLKGTKMRVIPSEILIKTFETYGSNPVPIEFAELYNALQQGVVNAQENPLETINSNKLYEVQDHLSITDHGYQFYMIVANLDWFNGLSPELQKVLTEAEEEARMAARELTQQMAAKRLEEFPKLGLEVHKISEEDREKFVKLSLPLHKEFSNTPEKKELLEMVYKDLGIKQ
ncbi:TRAP transporter substrate-binding protein [Peribacillus saganii]|uniref:TRAP transporter substrate-binding protein n=1 Tax=Peribacillus saganii TaxID=2303992 RepID=A0A372LSH7_9BACI|nr:TRAP transporter substrate-binding protein [Peribacillus saganii]RFU70504.1 TRAP transporter substrate-binding protein [Peribacillus saganii]